MALGIGLLVGVERERRKGEGPRRGVAGLRTFALVGLAGLQLPAVEPMIAASLLVLGLLVVTRVHLPAGVAMSVVGLFAVFHGVAHGHELAGEHDAALTLAGMVGATVLLHAAGIALGWALRHANAWLPRIAGAAVVGLGATLLAQAI